MADQIDGNNLFQTPQNGKISPWLALERVENHPLSDDYESIERSPSVDTALLIQSAARSLVDETSPSTAVSDDGSCEEGTARSASSPSPTLTSLQMKTLPAMPDEQDRKRFVVSRRFDFGIAVRGL
jgi:hypothetical protein